MTPRWLTQQLQQKLSNAPTLYYYPQIDSTNNEGKRLLTSKNKPYYVLSAQQTAGKGRLSRSFLSPAGTGVYLSYVFEQTLTELQPGLLTTSAAVITAQAIQQVFHVEPAIKWVNDLYLNDHKICGILAESVPITPGKVAVILGIGVNLQTPEKLPAELTAKVGGLNVPGNTDAFLLTLLSQLPNMVQTYQTGTYLTYYRKHAYLTGKTVTLNLGDRLITGVVQDVAANGALILQTPQGIQKFMAGEVQKVHF